MLPKRRTVTGSRQGATEPEHRRVRQIGRPYVVGLTGRFDFELQWDVTNPQSLMEAVRTQLGLELTLSRRPLDYLVVESAVQPQAW